MSHQDGLTDQERSLRNAASIAAARALLEPLTGNAPAGGLRHAAGGSAVPWAQESSLERIMALSHHAGMLGRPVLEALARFAPERGCDLTLETGCGRSTLLFSQLSREHHVFALDDRDTPDSSVATVLESGIPGLERLHFHYGPTQRTLVGALDSVLHGRLLDMALIDGPHGYPFPELEYWAIYPHLAPGALLVVDDVHIASISRLYDFLRQDDMFDLLHVELYTAFFRRNDAPATPPLGDHWWDQAFNVRAHPVVPAPLAPLRFDTPVSFTCACDGAERYLARGFGALEPGHGARSVRERAALRFGFEPGAYQGTLELGFSSDAAHAGREISLHLLTAQGFAALGTALLCGSDQSLIVDIDAADCHPAGTATLELRLPWVQPAAPERVDFRRLGITLRSLRLWRP